MVLIRETKRFFTFLQRLLVKKVQKGLRTRR